MDWILLTSKPAMIFGLLLGILASCSSSSGISVTDKIAQSKNKKNKLEARRAGFTVSKQKRFEDKTSHYGLMGVEAYQMNAVDINDDGYTDLVVLPEYYSQPQFYLYHPKLHAFLPTMESPFEEGVKFNYMAFYDFDKDGVVDLIGGVFNQKGELRSEPIKVYKGVRQDAQLRFVRQKNAIKLKALPSSSIIVLDYNLDGYLDLYVSNWYQEKRGVTQLMPDVLLEGSGLNFKDVSSKLSGEKFYSESEANYTNATPTMSASTCDINNDGWPDIITAATGKFHNKMWINKKNPKGKSKTDRIYEDYGKSSGYASDANGFNLLRGGGRTQFSSCADYNHDGIWDLYVGELSFSYDSPQVDRSSILTGKSFHFPPEYIRTEYIDEKMTHSWNQGDRRGSWFDYNNDGLLDLLVDNSGFPPNSRLILFEQQENHEFINRSPRYGVDILNPNKSIIIDLNRDGRLDIITSQIKTRNEFIKKRIYAFENITNNKNSSIRFRLDGKKSNAHGIGAMILLKTKRGTQYKIRRQWVEFSQGTVPAQNEQGVLFGLRDDEELFEAIIRWPILDQRTGKNLNQLYLFDNYNLKENVEVTFCENGKYWLGRKKCKN